MSSTSSSSSAGGLKGFLQRTGQVVQTVGGTCYAYGSAGAQWAFKWGGSTAFVIATSSVLVFMPLLFEIGREGEMLETERLQANDLKSKGYSDRQLKDMGFSDLVLHTPSVASMGAK